MKKVESVLFELKSFIASKIFLLFHNEFLNFRLFQFIERFFNSPQMVKLSELYPHTKG